MKNIPNLFTLINLFFGCIAIICILQNGITVVYTADGTQYTDIPERIWLAPLFMGLAALVDFIDGFLARLMKQGSPLGRELDSSLSRAEKERKARGGDRLGPGGARLLAAIGARGARGDVV